MIIILSRQARAMRRLAANSLPMLATIFLSEILVKVLEIEFLMSIAYMQCFLAVFAELKTYCPNN